MLFATFMIFLLLLSSTILQLAFCFDIERPSFHTNIGFRDENSYTNNQATVGIGVDLHFYHENALDPPYNGRDGISLRVACTANTREGIEYSPEPLDTLYIVW